MYKKTFSLEFKGIENSRKSAAVNMCCHGKYYDDLSDGFAFTTDAFVLAK